MLMHFVKLSETNGKFNIHIYIYMDIDEYWCINLYEREDRFKTASELFKKYGIPINFYRTHRDTNGVRGCTNSHLNVIKMAHQKNLNNIMIFEDDIFSKLSKEEFDAKMKEVNDFIKNNSYDIFYLGSDPDVFKRCTKRITDNIFKINAVDAHAYILSRTGINKYKDMEFTGIIIDRIYRECDNAYGIYPAIFYQYDSPSDVGTKFAMDRHTYVRIKENYIMHVNIPLPLLIGILTSLVFFFLAKNIIYLFFAIILVSYYIFKYLF